MSFKKIFEQERIYDNNNRYNVVQWLECTKYRHKNDFRDSKKVSYLKRICKNENQEARELMLELFSEIEQLCDACFIFEKDFEIIQEALLNIQEEIKIKEN